MILSCIYPFIRDVATFVTLDQSKRLDQLLAAEHPALARSLENYAALLRRMNREAEAVAMEARANTIRVELQRRSAEKLFTARSVDYPNHPLWLGLEATITEIQRDDRPFIR